jgi:hypothetical protein
MLKVEARLAAIEEFIDEKRDVHLLGVFFVALTKSYLFTILICVELRQVVTLIDKEVRAALDAVFNHVVSETLYSVSEEWTQKTSRFIQLYSSAQMEKESLLGQLKHRLGHPSATQELKDLDAQAQKTVAELHEYMGQMNVELRDGLGRISQQVLDQVEFLTAAWSGLLDGLVMIQHVDVPRKISYLGRLAIKLTLR